MAAVTRLLVAGIGLFNIAIGLMFLLNPAGAAGGFFLIPDGSQGMATLRADFPGFFITGGSFALIGAVQKDARALLVPLMLLAIAIAGRGVSLLADGAPPTAFPPMVVEAVMILILLLARRSFGRAA
ncbi:hypothetical protein [Sandarakinorhabdus rubra]|uniref:hypothetical protein n=1 Tax=Sandarakinorhabdus rubra TaxID=2672568 RepID=UPI0013DA5C34|nr:hypothetical protein [Sandarakinorhabdus rubra]